jgi:phosphoglycolate phosphatase-like HAD superfamily hydrolase
MTQALVLFDIDGTLLRRAGPQHKEALMKAARRVTGIDATTDGVVMHGMLDRDIVTQALLNAGEPLARIRRHMPEIVGLAQSIYARSCPDMRSKVCPGARMLLYKLSRRRIPAGLVTGNLTRIGWKKIERAGLRRYLRFGAFAEFARDRAGLVSIAMKHARREGWIQAKESGRADWRSSQRYSRREGQSGAFDRGGYRGHHGCGAGIALA